jgi:DNA-binding GntR family transcriptional regulator
LDELIMSPKKINRAAFEPAYLQLINILREQISKGLFRAGDCLPSESQLCKTYKVSPMTVRRAINALIEQGVVSTVQGRGTFVRPLQLSTVAFGLDQFQRLFTEGADTRVKILEAGIVSADAERALKLRQPEGSRIILIRRLIARGEEPLIYHREYLVYDSGRPVVEAEMEIASLHGLFAGGEASTIKWGELSISTVVLSEEAAGVLKSESGKPAFHLEHLFYDFDEQPVSWGGFICRGDVFKFNAIVGIVESGVNLRRGKTA